MEEHTGEQETGGRGPVYAIGDVHGHHEALADALIAAGLIDGEHAWSGGDARVWFLGDFFDRGPDGIGALELAMRLAEEAPEHGGEVHALLGNHEILALGMHHFGERELPSDLGPRSFARSWRLNGGLDADQERLSEKHVAWLSGLDAMALAGDHLLMHSDTLEYFGWGRSITEINDGVREVLASDDLEQWWECWRRMTSRYAFRGGQGATVAGEVMRLLGGERIVHGHSVIADQLGVLPSEIDGPHSYAEGRVLGVDGGVFVGGPCLVVRLPYGDETDQETGDGAGTEDAAGDSADADSGTDGTAADDAAAGEATSDEAANDEAATEDTGTDEAGRDEAGGDEAGETGADAESSDEAPDGDTGDSGTTGDSGDGERESASALVTPESG